MAPTHEIVRFLDDLLDPGAFADYCPNGLQVPGRPEVDRVVTGVSGSLELFERAVAADAGLVLVHHGIFWEKAPRALSSTAAARLRALLTAEVNLAAYHLPLDAHPEVGNNALLANALGATAHEPFAEHGGRAVGVTASFGEEGVEAGELFARVAEVTHRDPLVFGHGPGLVRSLGIVSGGAAGDLDTAIAAGLDGFLTGEPSEPAMTTAREAGVHFVAAGHYATETFGVRRLGELLAERFGVAHEFIDIPNPV
jgi:dinuclear metal center YbgI/SA1388 family protein